jgi:asparagine synthase (glutamine-hydrolysing)
VKSILANLEEAVELKVKDQPKIAVSFSGGIDSSVIAVLSAKNHSNVTLLCVGTKNSHDIQSAKKAAEKLGLKLVSQTLTEKQVLELHKKAQKILQTSDWLQTSIGTVNLAVAKLARKKGFHVVLSGSGADELFCGYYEFEETRKKPKSCEQKRKKRMKELQHRDIKREERCAKEYRIEVRYPFLDKKVVKSVLQKPAIKNLEGKYGAIRKSILRNIGEKIGLPKEIVEKPKKAMQYGSGFQKVLLKGTKK